MLKNYLLVAYRSFTRQWLFAVINIFGLAIGLCVFILTSLYVAKQYSYDQQWDNADQIYWVTQEIKYNDLISQKVPYMPFVAMPYVEGYFSDEIELSTRLALANVTIVDNKFPQPIEILLAEASLLDIFNFDVIAGSLEKTLTDPRNIALSENFAKRYFGVESPIDEIVTLTESDGTLVDYQVTGVYAIPDEGESSIYLPAFALLDQAALTERGDALTRWDGDVSINFFILKQGADVEKMNERLVSFVNQYVHESRSLITNITQMSDVERYEFQALRDAHFDSVLLGTEGDQAQVNIIAIIALLVLFIAGTNFVILSTAKANSRLREVGVRKVFGANKLQLTIQFIGEAVLLALIALVIGLSLAELILPAFSVFVGQELTITVFEPNRLLLLSMLAIIVGLASGVYPALVLANFTPQRALKVAAVLPVIGSSSVRSVLVVLQFTIAIILIIATLTLYLQLSFMRNRDPGFSLDNIFVVELFYEPEARVNLAPLVNELQGLAGVVQVAQSTRQANTTQSGTTTFASYQKKSGEDEFDSQGMYVDDVFFDMYSIPIIAGRSYDHGLDIQLGTGDNSNNNQNGQPERQINNTLVINRLLSEYLGFQFPEAAIGQIVQQKPFRENSYLPVEIIGVVENSQFLSLRETMAAEFYLFYTTNSTIITVNFEDSAANTVRDDIEEVWHQVMGDTEFHGNFVTQNIALEFSKEENDGKLLMTLSLLSIFIACLGLYGLAAFTIRHRVKEIGIRKAIGADVGSIVRLFIWQFYQPVLVANVIALPIALWLMMEWLQSFAYQIKAWWLIPIFLIASLLALFIAWLAVGSSAANAAQAKPIESLRDEG